MTSEEKQKFKEDLMSVGVLHWQKGPALGGAGIYPIRDNKEYLIIILRNEVREIHYAKTEEFDGMFKIVDSNGEEHTFWNIDQWAWIAEITPQSLPAEMK